METEIKLIKQGTDYHLVKDKKVIGSTHNEVADEYKLSLSNCQEIEFGYDLEAIIKETLNTSAHSITDHIKEEGFVIGFQKALELMGDKKFSENDIYRAFEEGERQDRSALYDIIRPTEQTEWEVEIEMETYQPTPLKRRQVTRKLDNGEEVEWTCYWDNGWFSNDGVRIPNVIDWEKLPVLDDNGCLILKRKQND